MKPNVAHNLWTFLSQHLVSSVTPGYQSQSIFLLALNPTFNFCVTTVGVPLSHLLFWHLPGWACTFSSGDGRLGSGRVAGVGEQPAERQCSAGLFADLGYTAKASDTPEKKAALKVLKGRESR